MMLAPRNWDLQTFTLLNRSASRIRRWQIEMDSRRPGLCNVFAKTGSNALEFNPAAAPTEGKTKEELKLQLQPDQSVVIARQERGEIEYLDPRYRPTQMLGTEPFVHFNFGLIYR